MPTETIIILSLIASAFSLFAVGLAYGEYQTRHFKREADPVVPQREGKHDQEWLKAA